MSWVLVGRGLDNAWWGGVFVVGERLAAWLNALVRGFPVHRKGVRRGGNGV